MKSFVGHIINKVIKSTPRSKKVSSDIKSVKPTKLSISKSIEKTKTDEYRKRYTALDKAEGKLKTGKQMMKEAQQERKNLVDTGRAFKFRSGKEIYTITPGENPKVKFASTIAKDAGRSKIKKFKKGKELEKKANGGRIGRRFGSPNPKKTNVEKIKETFGPKKNVPDKFKGFSKLPEAVQQKINKKLAKKV